MRYLRIASPGVADPTALTVMGVGSSRYSGRSDVIGQFASGSKLAAGLLLRRGLPPVVITGNLRMNYGSQPIQVDGLEFQQVTVKYSGTDLEGRSRTSTEDLGYTTEWGVADWDDVTMGPREYVANAIDSVTKQGISLEQVEVDLVDKIRAKAGWTQVYIPLNEEIQRFYEELNLRFLHFGRQDLLGKKMFPKVLADGKTRVYKKGVLVKVLDMPSVYDYNLGDELRLDESRNASDWDVKYAIAKSLANAVSSELAVVMKEVATAQDRLKLLETGLSGEYLRDQYAYDTKKQRQKEWQEAFRAVAGEQGVATGGLVGVASHIEAKGFVPFQMPSNWVDVLRDMDAPTEDKVLSASEKAGEVLSDATPDMIWAVDTVWGWLEAYGMTNGKAKPGVKGFMSIMDGGKQKRGEYRDGEVLLHTDIGTGRSPLLLKVSLEEVVHAITGAGDMSRDLQDFLFRLVVEILN